MPVFRLHFWWIRSWWRELKVLAWLGLLGICWKQHTLEHDPNGERSHSKVNKKLQKQKGHCNATKVEGEEKREFAHIHHRNKSMTTFNCPYYQQWLEQTMEINTDSKVQRGQNNVIRDGWIAKRSKRLPNLKALTNHQSSKGSIPTNRWMRPFSWRKK